MTEGEARLTWSEQKMQTRVKGPRRIRCKVIIGRHHRYKKYDAGKARKTWRESWTTGSPVIFENVVALADVLDKKGSVHTPHFEFYSNRAGTSPAWAEKIRKLLKQDVDFLTEPFTGANEFRTEIVTTSSLREGETEE